MKVISIPDNRPTREQLMMALRAENTLRMEGWTLRFEPQFEDLGGYILRLNGIYYREFNTAGQAADFCLTEWRGRGVEVV